MAVKARRNQRASHATPVFVDVNALLRREGRDRLKFLREECDCKDISEKRQRPIVVAGTLAELVEAVRPVVNEPASPGGHTAPPGTPLLQPTDERRRTGSHYTPRELTEPIMRHALAPAFALGTRQLPTKSWR